MDQVFPAEYHVNLSTSSWEKNAFTYLTNRIASKGLTDSEGRGENYAGYQFNLQFFIMIDSFLIAYYML